MKHFGAIRNTLTLGIKQKTNIYYLLTPIAIQIQRDYSDELAIYDAKTIVLGMEEKIANSFLNKLIRFETLLTAMQYFSWQK
jgi:hypothetical protein